MSFLKIEIRCLGSFDYTELTVESVAMDAQVSFRVSEKRSEEYRKVIAKMVEEDEAKFLETFKEDWQDDEED